MARDAGVSRQHFSRQFREHLGISPKLYCRLARFHAALAHTHSGRKSDWAETALELGYADQSHMIAEFRQFSALTPQALVSGRWFHPFIERARRCAPRLSDGSPGKMPTGRPDVEGINSRASAATRSCDPSRQPSR